MVWVARDVAERARRQYGQFAALDWERFALVAGIRWRVEPLPEWLPALRVGMTVVLRRQLCRCSMAWWFWHEVGHIMLHPGNALADIRCVLAEKAEQQANTFAVLYPCWTSTPLWHRLPAVTWDRCEEIASVGVAWGGGL